MLHFQALPQSDDSLPLPLVDVVPGRQQILIKSRR